MKNVGLLFAMLVAGCASPEAALVAYHPTPLAVLVADTNQARFAVMDMPSLLYLQGTYEDVEVLLTTRSMRSESENYKDVPFFLLRMSNVGNVPDTCWQNRLYADQVPVLVAAADYTTFRACPVEELTPMLDSMETAKLFLQVPWGTGSNATYVYEDVLLRILKWRSQK